MKPKLTDNSRSNWRGWLPLDDGQDPAMLIVPNLDAFFQHLPQEGKYAKGKEVGLRLWCGLLDNNGMGVCIAYAHHQIGEEHLCCREVLCTFEGVSLGQWALDRAEKMLIGAAGSSLQRIEALGYKVGLEILIPVRPVPGDLTPWSKKGIVNGHPYPFEKEDL